MSKSNKVAGLELGLLSHEPILLTTESPLWSKVATIKEAFQKKFLHCLDLGLDGLLETSRRLWLGSEPKLK